jgi:hypothetical protein
LGFGEIVDLVGKIAAQAPDGTGIGVDGLGLQPLELEVLECVWYCRSKCSAVVVVMLVYPHEILHNQTPQQRGGEGAGYVVWLRKAIPPRSGFVQRSLREGRSAEKPAPRPSS